MNDFRAMLVVARRELMERVRSKWFVVMTLIGPIGMIAMIVVPALIASSSTAGTRVEIIDKSGTLGPSLVAKLTEIGWNARVVPPETPDAVELEHIRDKTINGFIVVAPDALDSGEIVYSGDNASSQGVNIVLREVINAVVRAERGKRAGITKTTLDPILKPATLKTRHTTGQTEGTSGMGAFLIAYVLAFVLYMVITIYGVAVMRSVVTEKTSRVMELMVAAVKPRSLMGGKILGVGGAGLIQIAVWLTMGAITLTYRETILGWFGASAGGSALPPFELLEVTVVLVYFVLGFFFYAAMYAAVGAMVSSEQDTQQVQLPVTMLLVVGVLCLQVVSNAPRGSASTIMSNVPLWSPMIMPMRYVLGGATLGEVGISLLILIVSTAIVVRAAAKIYRVGVLMYGKRPSLRELVRWLRY
ncbi:MAG: ABC transporter permease [Kofleriaceae bacterium]